MPREKPNDVQVMLGAWAEERARLELVAAKDAGDIQWFCRPEWFVMPRDGNAYLVEVKGQEMFTGPPFDGHGLPTYQAEKYMRLYELYGLPTMLRIYDPAGWIYLGWIHELEAGDPAPCTSKTGSRRIYPISGFTRKPDPFPLREAA